jgi:hypothetical protein
VLRVAKRFFIAGRVISKDCDDCLNPPILVCMNGIVVRKMNANSILSLSCNQLVQAVREPEQSKYAADLLWLHSRLMFPHHVPKGCVTRVAAHAGGIHAIYCRNERLGWNRNVTIDKGWSYNVKHYSDSVKSRRHPGVTHGPT